MSEQHISLYRPLMDYIEFWERLRRRSIPLFSQVAHPGIQYIDPYRNLQGIEHMSQHMEDRFEIFQDIKYKCSNYSWGARDDGNIAYLHWDIYAERKGRENQLSGISEIKFYEDKKVCSHIDYWNTTEDFFEEPTIVKSVVKTLKSRYSQ